MDNATINTHRPDGFGNRGRPTKKRMTPQQRLRAVKRSKGWVPYEAWVHNSNYEKLAAAVKRWQQDTSTPMVMDIYPELTPPQRRFEMILSQYPKLYDFWDFERRDCDITALTKAFGSLSSGEQIMASFFMVVWKGNPDIASFDIVDAGKSLDDTHRQVIADWLLDPFYP